MFKIITPSLTTHHDSSIKIQKDQAFQSNLTIILVQNIGHINTADVLSVGAQKIGTGTKRVNTIPIESSQYGHCNPSLDTFTELGGVTL